MPGNCKKGELDRAKKKNGESRKLGNHTNNH
jgi:hypothetical protein